MEDAMCIVAAAEVYATACQSKTESLSKWISSVRSKATKVKKQRKKDLRTLAVLSRTLRRAEDELVRKQRARALRWTLLQAEIAAQARKDAELDASIEIQEKSDDLWNNELKNLDDFFNELSNVKIPETAR